MAKTEAEIRERKEKKDKKRKREEAGAADGEDGVAAKKEKKDKKEKKRKSLEPQTAAADGDVSMAVDDDDEAQVATGEVPRAALVPFAHPLADEKAQKKVLKVVKKAAKNKAIKRGVKECVKSIRKSSAGDPASLVDTNKTPSSIVIVAADISPMDVISHIPVLCEDHNIPYIFVPSRSELGIAGATKRPTSIIAITSKPGNLKGATADADWDEQYKDLHKIVLKAGATTRT